LQEGQSLFSSLGKKLNRKGAKDAEEDLMQRGNEAKQQSPFSSFGLKACFMDS
jgi:hypothetical protein